VGINIGKFPGSLYSAGKIKCLQPPEAKASAEKNAVTFKISLRINAIAEVIELQHDEKAVTGICAHIGS
jgi:hypothetical protein